MATMPIVAAVEVDHAATMTMTTPVTVTSKLVTGELPDVPTHDPSLALVMPSAPTAPPVLPERATVEPTASTEDASKSASAPATSEDATRSEVVSTSKAKAPAAVANYAKLYPDDTTTPTSVYPTLPTAPSAPYPDLGDVAPPSSAVRHEEAPPSYDAYIASTASTVSLSATQSEAEVAAEVAAAVAAADAAEAAEMVAKAAAAAVAADEAEDHTPSRDTAAGSASTESANASTSISSSIRMVQTPTTAAAEDLKYVQCTSCQQWLQVLREAEMIFCPTCESVSACGDAVVTEETTPAPPPKLASREPWYSCLSKVFS